MGDLISKAEVLSLVEHMMETYWDRKQILSIVRNGIEKLPSTEQWTPMSDRPPEKPGRYLVTNCEFEVDWNIWVNSEWLYQNDAPIAWMNMPEPYDGETK